MIYVMYYTSFILNYSQNRPVEISAIFMHLHYTCSCSTGSRHLHTTKTDSHSVNFALTRLDNVSINHKFIVENNATCFVSFRSELAEFLVQICAVSEVYFCIHKYWIHLKITRLANIDVTWINKTSLDHKFFTYYSSVCDIFVRFEFTGLLGSFYSQASRLSRQPIHCKQLFYLTTRDFR